MSFINGILDAFRNYAKQKKRRFCSAIVVAAGSASRMGGTDKIMANLDGIPVLIHTLRSFEQAETIREVVVVTRIDRLAQISELCRKYALTKVRTVVRGGNSRLESVICGLDCVSTRATHVAIHDGARPLVKTVLIDKTVNKAIHTGASAPALPVKDTIKIARGSLVMKTPKRSELFAVQTPQVFDFDLIRGALIKAKQENWDVTDDCSAVEKFGMTVHLVDGDEENIKITTPLDLTVAEAIFKKRSARK